VPVTPVPCSVAPWSERHLYGGRASVLFFETDRWRLASVTVRLLMPSSLIVVAEGGDPPARVRGFNAPKKSFDVSRWNACNVDLQIGVAIRRSCRQTQTNRRCRPWVYQNPVGANGTEICRVGGLLTDPNQLRETAGGSGLYTGKGIADELRENRACLRLRRNY